MYKLNLITIVSIVAAVSLVVGMTAPAAFAQDNMTMNMDDNMNSMGNMTGGNATSMTGGNATSMTGGNATSMAGNMTETESITTAGETGYSGNNPILP